MEELQFIIPDLDITPYRNYLQDHVNHALEVLSDPDTPLISEIGTFELERLNAASKALEELSDIYQEWQYYRKNIRDFIISVLQSMEKFDKEPESAE